jgi:hypothetical protein
LTVDSTGVSVGGEFSYFYNNSLTGNAQVLANLGIGPQYFNLSIGSNGLSRYISIRSNELKMSPILILVSDTTTNPLTIKNSSANVICSIDPTGSLACAAVGSSYLILSSISTTAFPLVVKNTSSANNIIVNGTLSGSGITSLLSPYALTSAIPASTSLGSTTALIGKSLYIVLDDNTKLRFNTDFGLRYEYYNGIDFELPTCRYSFLECVPNGITLKHNRNKLVIDGTGSTVTGSLFLNNDLDEQMAYITNTGIAKFNGLIVNGTNTLTVNDTGVSVGGLKLSYFYNNSLTGNAQTLTDFSIGPKFLNLTIAANGLSRYIAIR